MTVLMLVAALYHPGSATAHGGADVDQDPCKRLGNQIEKTRRSM